MTALEHANEVRGEATAWDLYPMAMIEHARGHEVTAGRRFEDPERWLPERARPDAREDLANPRAGARAELGLEDGRLPFSRP